MIYQHQINKHLWEISGFIGELTKNIEILFLENLGIFNIKNFNQKINHALFFYFSHKYRTICESSQHLYSWSSVSPSTKDIFYLFSAIVIDCSIS